MLGSGVHITEGFHSLTFVLQLSVNVDDCIVSMCLLIRSSALKSVNTFLPLHSHNRWLSVNLH